MKEWFHKMGITTVKLDEELNAFSKQGWEIYKIWRVGYDSYGITTCREKAETESV